MELTQLDLLVTIIIISFIGICYILYNIRKLTRLKLNLKNTMKLNKFHKKWLNIYKQKYINLRYKYNLLFSKKNKNIKEENNMENFNPWNGTPTNVDADENSVKKSLHEAMDFIDDYLDQENIKELIVHLLNNMFMNEAVDTIKAYTSEYDIPDLVKLIHEISE